jgi:hypothetical protein
MTDRDDDRNRPDSGRQPNLAAVAEALSTAIGGATRMTRARAKETAERLLTQAGFDHVDLGRMDLGGAAADATTRINHLADEIMAARKANREQLQRAVAGELDKSLNRLGLARADEVAALRGEVAQLRADLGALSKQTSSGSQTTSKAASARKTAKAPSTSSTAARKATKKSTTAKKSAAKTTTSQRSTSGSGSASASKSSAKKTTKKS